MRYSLLLSFIILFVILVFIACPTMGKDNVTLHGRVIDISTAPVEAAEVYVFDSKQVKRPADFISKPTDATGSYSIVMPPGKYWALAVHRKSGAKFGPLMHGDRHSGDPVILDFFRHDTIEADFTIMGLREAARQHMKRTDTLIRISGRILDDQGKPVEMAYVMADRKKKITGIPTYLSAWTKKDGIFELYLPKGSFYLGATSRMPPAGYESLGALRKFKEDVAELEIVLDKEQAKSAE